MGDTHGLEHLLCEVDGDLHDDPVASRRTRQVLLVEAVRRKPLVDEVDALVVRGHESLDFFLGEVVAIALVEGIAEE